jgi:hypothetical protein
MPMTAESQAGVLAWSSGLAIGMGVLAATLPESTGQMGIVAAILVLATACFSPVVLLRVSRVSPAFIYGLATFLLIGLGSIAWLGTPALGTPGLNQRSIAGAVLTLAAGIAVFWVGYLIVRPPTEVPPERPLPIAPIWIVSALFIGGLAASGVLIATGRFGYQAIFAGPSDLSWWQQWVQTATGLTGIAIIMAGLHAFGNGSRSHRRALLIMVLLSLGLGFLAGYKAAVLAPLATTLFVYYFYRRRLPWKVVFVTGLVPFILVPANLAYRSTITSGSGSSTTLFGAAVDMSLEERIAATFQWAAERRVIDSIAQVKRLTPSPHPFLGAAAYAQIPAITLIPRVLWPGKPTENEAIVFGRVYFGAGSGSVNSYAITNIGDLYLHAGSFGVVVGMLVWGAFVGIGFRWLWRRQSPSALIVYVVALFRMAQVEVTFTSLISEAFRAVVFAWLVGRLIYGPMPRLHPVSGDRASWRAGGYGLHRG